MVHTVEGMSHWERVSRLVEALERTRPMGDAELRRQCLEVAGERLDIDLLAVVRTGAVPRSQLYDLVRLLEELRGGLWVLADTISFFAPGARSTEAFRRLVLETPVQPMLSPGELREIHVLLRAVPDRLPIAGIHRAARGTFEHLPPGREDAVGAFDHLAEANARADGLFPFMVYIEHLAVLVPRDLGDPLRAWDTAVADTLNATDALRELRAGLVPVAAQRVASPAYLAIQVERIDADAERYAVSSWTKEDATARPFPGHHELLCSPEELEGTVETVIADGEASLAGLDAQIQLEFILGRDLIGRLPVDEWATHRESGLPRPIVRHYPVVLRSLERQREPALQRVWNRRWRSMSDHPGECRWQVCGGPDGIGPADLQDTLNRDTEGQVVAILLLDAPGPREIGVPHAYDVALREGIPAMLWHRSRKSDTLLHDLAQEILGAPEFGRLPGRVHEARVTTPACDGVALLHDDPGNLYARWRPYGLPRSMGRRQWGDQ
ncbi:effector-associated domain 2-containing protein [Yinghuangia sp. YIM S10712]|uniref:VMAP-C domain-containing protein n=1 Tax=Yinghuangia sp. YIM S10712 TaxID=3436930 RepID=UPI003F53A025